MGRGRSTAPADQAGTGLDQAAGIPAEVLGIHVVLEPGAVHPPGKPGVRLGRQHPAGVLAQSGQHREHPLRAQCAVRAHCQQVQVCQGGAHLGRGFAAEHVTVGGERRLGDHRNAEFTRHLRRFDQLVQVTERLDHHQIDPGCGQDADLLAQRRRPQPRRDASALLDRHGG
jgi:hypothetical protein